MAGAKKGGSSPKKPVWAIRMLLFMLLVTAIIFLASTIVLIVCLIPAIVSALLDHHRPKTAWITIGAMNLAGALPALFNLWQMGHNKAAALEIVTTPSVLLVAYSGAAVGFGLYHYMTPLVAGVVVGKNRKRLKEIEKRSQELVRRWGDDVK
ncbi:MAG: hypothetical protein OXT65_01290 [Alphaproteobacteria bacterium]|nr:hypothetical protein [Alphaproteobacteria bacterium]